MPDSFGRPGWTGQTQRSGINYSEYAGDGAGPFESIGPDGFTATRILDIDPSNASAFVLDILGDNYLDPTGKLRRYLPESHNRYPFLYATSCRRVMNMGTATRSPASSGQNETLFKLARYEVTYTRPLYKLTTDSNVDTPANTAGELIRYVERYGPKCGHEAYPLPATSFKWNSGPLSGQPVMEPAAKVFPLGSFVLRWRLLPSIPDASGFVGKTNQTAFLGFGIETLLWMSSDPTPNSSCPIDRMYYDLEILFSWRPKGWNKLYCKTSSTFEDIVQVDNSKPYQPTPFENFFTNTLPQPP